MCAAVNWNNDDRVQWTMKGGVVRKKQGVSRTKVSETTMFLSEVVVGSSPTRGAKKRKTTQSVVFLFLFYDGGLERTVQTNSPVDCLSVRGFSAEKQVQHGSFLRTVENACPYNQSPSERAEGYMLVKKSLL